MPLSTSQVQSAYVTFFNRPADPVGLNFWLTNGSELPALLESFSTSAEYTAQYAGKTSAQIVNTVYNNLFSRDAEPAGLLFWANALANGTLSIANIASAISSGAQTTDATAFANKTAAAVAFTAAVDTTPEILGYAGAASLTAARAFISSVTTDASLAAAIAPAALNASVLTVTTTGATAAATGQTFTLTAGIDTLTGTTGNDTFVASDNGTPATSTSNLGDTINGGAGTDTLKLYSSAAATVLPGLTSIENLYIQDTVHESRNASTITGLTNLELNGGTTIAAGAITATLGAGQSLTLSSITDGDLAADGATQGEIIIASTGVTALTVNLNAAGAQTGADASTDLDLDVTGTTVTSLTLNSTGVNNISLANAGAAITTLTVTGAGSTSIWGTTATTITTFNAAAATGAATVDLSASAGANQTITGGTAGDTLTVDLARNITLDAGAGNDTVTLANPTAANLSSTVGAADSIKGGDGTDTLVVTSAGAVALAGDTALDRAVITGFEQLRASDNLNASTFDISAFGINYLQINAATTTGAATVNGFTSGATVEYRGAADSTVALNVGMTGATAAGTPNDTLNITLNANLVTQATAADAFDFLAGVSGINKLVVSTADRVNADGATTRTDGYILTLSNDNNVDTLTVKGSSELAFTSTASTAALATVDASGLSGDLILNLATNGLTQGVTVTGGSGVNTVTGTGFGDIIVGGARAETITGGAGSDVLTGGTGADTFAFVASDSGGAPSSTVFDTITDFAKASDIIDFTAGALVNLNGSAASSGTAGLNAQAIATFNAADNTLALKIIAVEAGINASGTAAVRQYAVFEEAGSSYVFVSDGVDGVGAADVLIKLTGVTSLTTSTLTGGDLTLA